MNDLVTGMVPGYNVRKYLLEEKIDTLLISGHFVWETNLQMVDGVIPWAPGKGEGGTEEHILVLGGNQQLYDVTKDFVDAQPHGVVCEF